MTVSILYAVYLTQPSVAEFLAKHFSIVSYHQHGIGIELQVPGSFPVIRAVR